MTSNGAEALIRTLVGAGVDTCFTNPGTSEIHLVAALDDVDDTALQEVGGLENKLLSTTFYLTPDAISMFDEFFANCGGDFDDGQSRKGRSLDLQNCQVLAVVSHRLNEDKTRTFAEVRRTAKAD